MELMNVSKDTLYRRGCNVWSLEPSGASGEGLNVKAGSRTSPCEVRIDVCTVGDLL